MESKKRFGEYICHRRKELGLTQREFADKLYVTESAVSKWERGLSYPDVTLLRDICAVLDVSEHELLTASVDTERRTAERLAEKYLRLTRTYRAIQYVIYGAVLLGCAVGNLAVQGTLSWFWVALPAVLLAASLTLVPALAGLRQELAPCRASIALGCALASLELLLGACCLYTGGDWFPMVGMSVLFGLSLFILPVVLCQLSLPVLEGRQLSVYLLAETALLELVLLVGCLYTGGDWFLMAGMGVLFGLSLFILPVLLWQLPVGAFIRRNKLLAWLIGETALLLALLAVGQWYDGGDWLWRFGIPLALVGLSLPWGLMALGRYLPATAWGRASLCFLWAGLWTWPSPWVVDRIMQCNGWNDDPYRLSWPFAFSQGLGPVQTIGVVVLVLWFVAAALALAGFMAARRRR